MNLILPSIDYKESYIDYIKELGCEERYPFPMDFDYSKFDEMLAKIHDFSKGINLPPGYVPSSTFWMVDSDHLVGVTNIRHFLNKRIEYFGGHIGLGIRPSYRGKGLGSLLMGLSIQKLNGMGIQSAHIHCYKENIASEKAITSNGGVLASELNIAGKIVQRYVVTNT